LEETCDVCGGCLDEENISRCSLCGRKFHMAWSVHAEVKNCGRVFNHEILCAIGFVCNTCLAQNPELSQSIIDIGQQMPPC